MDSTNLIFKKRGLGKKGFSEKFKNREGKIEEKKSKKLKMPGNQLVE
jgi:hypothetical protein